MIVIGAAGSGNPSDSNMLTIPPPTLFERPNPNIPLHFRWVTLQLTFGYGSLNSALHLLLTERSNKTVTHRLSYALQLDPAISQGLCVCEGYQDR